MSLPPEWLAPLPARLAPRSPYVREHLLTQSEELPARALAPVGLPDGFQKLPVPYVLAHDVLRWGPSRHRDRHERRVAEDRPKDFAGSVNCY